MQARKHLEYIYIWKRKKKSNSWLVCEEKQLRTQNLAHLWEGFRIQGGNGKRHPGFTTSENNIRASQLQKTTSGPHNFRKRHPSFTTSENDTRASQLQKTVLLLCKWGRRHLFSIHVVLLPSLVAIEFGRESPDSLPWTMLTRLTGLFPFSGSAESHWSLNMSTAVIGWTVIDVSVGQSSASFCGSVCTLHACLLIKWSAGRMKHWRKTSVSSCSSWEQTGSSREQTGGLRITSLSHIRSPNSLCCRQRHGSVDREFATPSLLILSRSAGYSFSVIIIAVEWFFFHSHYFVCFEVKITLFQY